MNKSRFTEALASDIGKLGYSVRHPAPYVKPFMKCQKNDTVDAEAICEAAMTLPLYHVKLDVY